MHMRLSGLARYHVTIVTGRGNNGGDGFILARHLWHGGVKTRVLMLAPAGHLRGDARRAYEMAHAYGVPMLACTTPQAWRRAVSTLRETDIVVDAMLGTGLNKPPTGLYAEAIETLNALQKPIVAVDIPSGLSADVGHLYGAYIQATYTVTFALPKRGLLLYPAAAAVGELHVADIAIPMPAIEAEGIQVALLSNTIYAACFLTAALTLIKVVMAISWSSQVLSVNPGLASWRVELPCVLGPVWSPGLYLQA